MKQNAGATVKKSKSKCRFKDNLVEASYSKVYEEAIQEWRLIMEETREEQDGHCICNHKIKIMSYMYNLRSKNTIQVGTVCRKKFKMPDKPVSEALRDILSRNLSSGQYEVINDIIQYSDSVEEQLIGYFQDRYDRLEQQCTPLAANPSSAKAFSERMRELEELLDEVRCLLNEYEMGYLRDITEVVGARIRDERQAEAERAEAERQAQQQVQQQARAQMERSRKERLLRDLERQEAEAERRARAAQQAQQEEQQETETQMGAEGARAHMWRINDAGRTNADGIPEAKDDGFGYARFKYSHHMEPGSGDMFEISVEKGANEVFVGLALATLDVTDINRARDTNLHRLWNVEALLHKHGSAAVPRVALRLATDCTVQIRLGTTGGWVGLEQRHKLVCAGSRDSANKVRVFPYIQMFRGSRLSSFSFHAEDQDA